MNMNARIELLKNLLTKKRWKTVQATLYSTERDFLSYLAGKTQTCVMPYDALSECQDTLEKIGLILPNGVITSVGMMYLEGVGQLESDPTQSIESADTRIDILKRAVESHDYKTIREMLTPDEAVFFDFLSGRCPTNSQSGEAIIDARATLVAIGLTDIHDNLTKSGFEYALRLYTHPAQPTEPSQSIEPAHTIEQELSNSPTALSDCLTEAASVVKGERQESYGPAERNLSCIAELWSSYLHYPITSRHVAVMMILLKAARDAHKPKHDNMVDICGYAYLADTIDKETALK